jgi:diacylglycerol kinase family enzyme
MWIAPQALINDGLFDVVVVEGISRLRVLFALRTVFSGKHLERTYVHHTGAGSVEVHSDDGLSGLDLEGEEGLGQDLHFTILPKAVNILLDPSTAAIRKQKNLKLSKFFDTKQMFWYFINFIKSRAWKKYERKK